MDLLLIGGVSGSGKRVALAALEDSGYYAVSNLPLAYSFDTSDLSAAALRSWIKDFISVDPSKLTLLFQSFGYKHGVPLDADLVFDIRCLPNPHYEPALAMLSGRDSPVVAYLQNY